MEKERVFLAIYEAGSLTRASKDLRLSLSSVSRILGLLEEELGEKLFKRSTRSLVPTEKGRIYADAVARALNLLEVGRKVITEEKVQDFKINCFTSLGERVLMPILEKLARKNPNLKFDVTLDDYIERITDHHYDLYLRYDKPKDSSYAFRSFIKPTYGLFATEKYLKERGVPKKLGDLSSHSCAGFSFSHSGIWHFKKDKKTRSIPVKSTFSSSSSLPLLQWVERSMGIAPCSFWYVKNHKGLKRVLPDYTVFFSEIKDQMIYGVYPKELRGNQTIIDILNELQVSLKN